MASYFKDLALKDLLLAPVDWRCRTSSWPQADQDVLHELQHPLSHVDQGNGLRVVPECVRLYELTAGQRSDCESQTNWRGMDSLEKPRDKPNLKL